MSSDNISELRRIVDRQANEIAALRVVVLALMRYAEYVSDIEINIRRIGASPEVMPHVEAMISESYKDQRRYLGGPYGLEGELWARQAMSQILIRTKYPSPYVMVNIAKQEITEKWYTLLVSLKQLSPYLQHPKKWAKGVGKQDRPYIPLKDRYEKVWQFRGLNGELILGQL